MIAVTFALPSESSDFLRLLSGRHQEVKVFHTGVGAAVCRRQIEEFLDSQRFDLLISSGFAGGVDPSLGVGDLFLGENFSDRELLKQARAVVICRVGTLTTTDRIIESPQGRTGFARDHDAAAVDMETVWISRACAAREIPMLSLRAISDTAAEPFPAPINVLFDLDQQRTNLWRLTAYLFTHPSAVVRLARFARQVATTRAELADALTLLVRTLV